jgi:hypothetical protein
MEKKETQNPEMRSDGWERFEKAVDAAITGGPKHKKATPKPKQSTSLGETKSKQSPK